MAHNVVVVTKSVVVVVRDVVVVGIVNNRRNVTLIEMTFTMNSSAESDTNSKSKMGRSEHHEVEKSG